MRNTISKTYASELHEHFRMFYPAWPPNFPIQLGHLGYLRDDLFVPKVTLKEAFKINVESEGSGPPADYKFMSRTGVSVSFTGKGHASTAGIINNKALLEVSFNSANAILFSAVNCRIESAKDHTGLGTQILSLFESGQWNDDWYVVTDVVEASSATILISSSDRAGITLELTDDAQSFDLITPETDLRVTKSADIGCQFIAQKRLKPLFRLSKVVDPLFGDTSFDPYLSFYQPDGHIDHLEKRRELLDKHLPVKDSFVFQRI